MKVKAEREWLVVCPKCKEEFHLAEREFANNRTFWTCFNCGLEFEVWRDKKDS